MTSAWLVFPALLVVLSFGAGLLVQACFGRRIPGELLLPLGFAAIVVAGTALASFEATAELTTPLIVAVALVGIAAGVRRGLPRPAPAPVAAFLFTALVFGAPVVATGEPTIAGYIRLDDTATWLALTDRIFESGRSLDGLAPSTYEATLAFNLGEGYPIGAFVPLGVGGELTGADVSRLVQPYMSVVGGLLALTLIPIARRLAGGRKRAALVASVAAQPALLVGYVQWGGVKEVAAALLLALVAVLSVRLALDPPVRGSRLTSARAALAPALACAAMLCVLSIGGVLWLLAPLALAAVLAGRTAGLREVFGRGLAVASLSAFLSVPALLSGALVPPTSSPLTSDSARGNLFEPLEAGQLAGIWPAGDFRGPPIAPLLTDLLIAAVVLAAIAGLLICARRRAAAMLVYSVGSLAGCALLVALGSPWVDGKAMATAAPALLLAALCGAAAILARRSRLLRAAGGLALAAIVAGVLWSNALAYRDASLAPHAQLAELERIGEMIAGEGPTLMTEYQPYGARHFLRDGDAEGVSELRRRLTPLENGESVPKGEGADTDELSPSGLLAYRTLVLRRSPTQSRPPSAYEQTWDGDHYEVWQRPSEALDEVPVRLALGDSLDPAGVLDCSSLADGLTAGPGGTVIAARRGRTAVAGLDDGSHPDGWGEASRTVEPAGSGAISGRIDIPRAGIWSAWLGGSIHGRVELEIDGSPVGEARHMLNNQGFFISLGDAELARGRHHYELSLHGADLHPGSGGRGEPIGPLIMASSEPADAELVSVPAARARSLCGKRWDWLEVSSQRLP